MATKDLGIAETGRGLGEWLMLTPATTLGDYTLKRNSTTSPSCIT